MTLFRSCFAFQKSLFYLFEEWDGTIENEIAKNKNRYYDQDQFLCTWYLPSDI